MLGCHDFCGHYDWTFHYIRRRFGQQAVRDLWADAIGGDSQSHYRINGQARGLRGLYETWVQTGEDEHCDWTFTLDESRNVLRWDMRQCPSKGFLLNNDRYADEDYCDHCMGWMIPLLASIGVEVAVHEHNHCGQCWGEMRVTGKPYESPEVPADIRNDPRWNRGHLDGWRNNVKLPVLDAVSRSADSPEVLTAWFRRFEQPTIVTDDAYVSQPGLRPAGVLIGERSPHVAALAQRFSSTPPAERPLLMHAYLPASPPIDFIAHDLPRPVPILPLLVRTGAYVHRPHEAPPTTQGFAEMLVRAVEAMGKSGVGKSECRNPKSE